MVFGKKEGCFSEYFTLPVSNLLEIPDSVSDETAVFIEPLAAAYEIIEQVHIKPTDKVALLGDGKLGLSIALVLGALNIDITHISENIKISLIFRLMQAIRHCF